MIQIADFRFGRFGGLGQTVGETPEQWLQRTKRDTGTEEFLRHDLVPERPSSAVGFSSIKDNTQARAYAARAFHAAVDNGLSRRGRSSSAWADAAALYFRAWQDAKTKKGDGPEGSGLPVEHVKAFIAYGNRISDDAKRSGGGTSPATIAVKPEDRKMGSGSNKVLIGVALVGGGLLWFMSKRKRKG